MLLNPKLYEINTRIWLKRFGKEAKLSDVPDEYFQGLAEKGINIIWLMGIWKTPESVIEKCCFSADLITAYNKSLSDWKKEDVIGSPYSVDSYEINSKLGTLNDLINLRKKLNNIGIKLMLDFVANHFSSDSELLKTRPELFLQAGQEALANDPMTFFRAGNKNKFIFAHGRDPFFPAWSDTVQLNYFNPETRKFLTSTLLSIAELCDGVRSDMAMLPLNNTFQNTWLGVLNKQNIEKPKTEFWSEAIETIKNKYPDFIFLAEAYWDLEWNLQKLGFDFTYDKRLADRLEAHYIAGVKDHLGADILFQLKSARFLENHDEQRAAVKFGERNSLAAAVLISTIPGMKFYFDGQFEGKKIKLPLQLGREPIEKPSAKIEKFYNKLLRITSNKIFTVGEFQKLDPFSAGESNNSYENMFAWEWKMENEKWIIVINYSDSTSQCRLRFETPRGKNNITLIDHLSDDKYTRQVDEIQRLGLFIELKNYHSHIFSVE